MGSCVAKYKILCNTRSLVSIPFYKTYLSRINNKIIVNGLKLHINTSTCRGGNVVFAIVQVIFK